MKIIKILSSVERYLKVRPKWFEGYSNEKLRGVENCYIGMIANEGLIRSPGGPTAKVSGMNKTRKVG